MRSKRDVLDQLKRDELLDAVDQAGLEVRDRRVPASRREEAGPANVEPQPATAVRSEAAKLDAAIAANLKELGFPASCG